MLPANDLIFCEMFEHAELFKRVIRAVVGKNEKVELIEPPLSQVAYKNPELSAQKKARLGSVRVDVQAEGLHKLYSLDLQQKYNETIILKRVVFYSFRMYTSQLVENMRYDRLKPACVTFIMTEDQAADKRHDIHRLTVADETTGRKYYDILYSYLVFVPNIIKNNRNKNEDLYIFSSFFTVRNQQEADEFYRNFGAYPLGRELIKLYGDAVKEKKRLLDLGNYNYYFTEKEYERVKLEDDKKHAQEIQRLKQEDDKKHAQEIQRLKQETDKKHAQEIQRLKQEADKKLNEADKKLNEADKKHEQETLLLKLETDKKLQEADKKRQETEIQTKLRAVINNIMMFHCSINTAMEAAELDPLYRNDVITELNKRNIFFTEQ